jgi:hypothetical protein
MMFKGVFVLCLCMLIAACSEHKSAKSETYVPPSPGILANATFSADSSGRIDAWSLTQHAGARSYALNAKGGVAIIERIDKEPWGALRQVFRHSDTKGMQGERLEFSAEVSGEFSGMFGAPFGVSGMGVRVRGIPKGANAMLAGSEVLFEKIVPMGPALGLSSWRRYNISFEVPKEGEASFIEIEVFFQMTYSGAMGIRGPSLIVL